MTQNSTLRAEFKVCMSDEHQTLLFIWQWGMVVPASGWDGTKPPERIRPEALVRDPNQPALESLTVLLWLNQSPDLT